MIFLFFTLTDYWSKCGGGWLWGSFNLISRHSRSLTPQQQQSLDRKDIVLNHWCLFIYIAHQSNIHLICLSAVHYSQLPFVFSASYVEKRRIRHFCSTLLRLNWRYQEYVTKYVKNQSWNMYGTILIAPDTECLNIKNYFPAYMTNIYHHLINRKNITTTVPPLVGFLLSILSTIALAGS